MRLPEDYGTDVRQQLRDALRDERSKAESMGVASGYPGGRQTDIKPVKWPKSHVSRSQRKARRLNG